MFSLFLTDWLLALLYLVVFGCCVGGLCLLLASCWFAVVPFVGWFWVLFGVCVLGWFAVSAGRFGFGWFCLFVVWFS